MYLAWIVLREDIMNQCPDYFLSWDKWWKVAKPFSEQWLQQYEKNLGSLNCVKPKPKLIKEKSLGCRDGKVASPCLYLSVVSLTIRKSWYWPKRLSGWAEQNLYLKANILFFTFYARTFNCLLALFLAVSLLLINCVDSKVSVWLE